MYENNAKLIDHIRSAVSSIKTAVSKLTGKTDALETRVTALENGGGGSAGYAEGVAVTSGSKTLNAKFVLVPLPESLTLTYSDDISGYYAYVLKTDTPTMTVTSALPLSPLLGSNNNAHAPDEMFAAADDVGLMIVARFLTKPEDSTLTYVYPGGGITCYQFHV